MITKIGLGLLFCTMAAAAASSHETETCKKEYWGWFSHEVCRPSREPSPVAVPEIEPASAIAGLTLMAGILALARGRRKAVDA